MLFFQQRAAYLRQHINWKNPLCSGLKHLYVFQGRDAIDLISSEDLDVSVGTQPKGTPKGKSTSYETAGSYLRASNTSFDVFGGYPFTVTIHADMRNQTLGATSAFICNTDFSQSSRWAFLIGYHIDAGGFRGVTRSTGSYVPVDGPSYDGSNPYPVVSYVARSETSRQVYCDGVAGAEVTTSVSYPAGIDAFSTGALARNNNWVDADHYDGGLFLVALHDRSLADVELKQLAKNPYLFFENRPNYLFASSGTAAISLPVMLQSYRQRRV